MADVTVGSLRRWNLGLGVLHLGQAIAVFLGLAAADHLLMAAPGLTDWNGGGRNDECAV